MPTGRESFSKSNRKYAQNGFAVRLDHRVHDYSRARARSKNVHNTSVYGPNRFQTENLSLIFIVVTADYTTII